MHTAKIIFPLIIVFLGVLLGCGEEVIELGQLGQEGELIFPRQVKEGPDGLIYVYDQSDAFIKVYSPQGNFIRKIGGKGQGPGEIQRADGVTFGFTYEGNLFFTEFFGGHPWITKVGLDGSLIKVIKPQISEFFGVAKAESLKNNEFLVEFVFIGQPKREKDYFYHLSIHELCLMDEEGRILSQVKRTEHVNRISYLMDGADSPIPFTPLFLWAPYDSNDNKAVLFSEGLNPILQIINHSGEIIGDIKTPLPPPEKVTGKDLAEWRKRRKEQMAGRDPDWWARFGKVIDQYKKSIYSQKPVIFSLDLTDEGNYLIGSRRDSDDPFATYWLLTKEGKQFKSIKTYQWILGITKKFIFFGGMDKEGFAFLKALKRQGEETEDILYFKGK